MRSGDEKRMALPKWKNELLTSFVRVLPWQKWSIKLVLTKIASLTETISYFIFNENLEPRFTCNILITSTLLFCNSFPYNYRRNHEWELWEREIEVRVFPSCYFEFSQASTSVLISITYGNTENCFYFFYKITRRKLKRGNSLLYQSVNSQYCSWWRMRWRIMAWTVPSFPYSYRNTAFNQSKLLFSKC